MIEANIWKEMERMAEINGMPIKPGVNICRWNLSGKCTNNKVTGNIVFEGHSRDWTSRQNCTFTIFGTSLCSGFITLIS